MKQSQHLKSTAVVAATLFGLLAQAVPNPVNPSLLDDTKIKPLVQRAPDPNSPGVLSYENQFYGQSLSLPYSSTSPLTRAGTHRFDSGAPADTALSVCASLDLADSTNHPRCCGRICDARRQSNPSNPCNTWNLYTVSGGANNGQIKCNLFGETSVAISDTAGGQGAMGDSMAYSYIQSPISLWKIAPYGIGAIANTNSQPDGTGYIGRQDSGQYPYPVSDFTITEVAQSCAKYCNNRAYNVWKASRGLGSWAPCNGFNIYQVGTSDNPTIATQWVCTAWWVPHDSYSVRNYGSGRTVNLAGYFFVRNPLPTGIDTITGYASPVPGSFPWSLV
ncbi:hypothetical protein ABW21_db0208636 [Orbilia brochopaga]|nr:hypothetical protein ABW21_db0208636 [Drechslerella brochopaga]